MEIHEIKKIKKIVADMEINEILIWLKNKFGKDLAMTTAFGYSGIVLLYHTKEIMPDLTVYFIDTGFHFKETLDLAAQLKNEWGINLKILKPTFDKTKIKNIIGDKPYDINPNLCCHYLKVEPLLRVLHTKAAWLSAIRRDQVITRSGIEKVELDGRGTLRFCPMAFWDKKEVWEFIKINRLPCNSLYDKGYKSIGCKPCTSKVSAKSDERDGRWKSVPKLECGINL